MLGGPAPEQVYPGTIEDRSGRGMRVSIPAPVAPGTAVRLDLRDEVAFGEVCYCQPLGDRYALGLELDQSLKNLEDLSRLVHALLGGGGSRNSDRQPVGR